MASIATMALLPGRGHLGPSESIEKTGWAAVGGQRPTNAVTSGYAYDYGGAEWATNRPLNRYIVNQQVFHCPADRGDALNPSAKTCWDGWGNSYLVAWGDGFRVRRVTGSAGKFYQVSEPMKASEIARKPTSKIIQGDWPWHANRVISDTRSEWHNVRGKRARLIAAGRERFRQRRRRQLAYPRNQGVSLQHQEKGRRMSSSTPKPKPKAMIQDNTRCIGCRACNPSAGRYR